ncbi:MAG: glycoside hydrolase family 9 protein [Chloroflexi bacterium]|nr:glycoside hydrolase family 9 protein [Chloroflexota bacterium]
MLKEQLAKLTEHLRPKANQGAGNASPVLPWREAWQQAKELYADYERRVEALRPKLATVPGLSEMKPGHAVLSVSLVAIVILAAVVVMPWRAPQGAAAYKSGRSTVAAKPAKQYEPMAVGENVPSEMTKGDMFSVNQVGYLPNAPKVALVKGAAGSVFKVVDVDTRKSVFAGRLGTPIQDIDSDDMAQEADFTPLTKPGSYVIVVQGSGSSHPFLVGKDVYDGLYKDAIKSYDDLARLAPAAFHDAQAYLAKDRGKKIDVSGGWPDAGDYGKYVPTAGITLGDLLLTAELQPEKVLKDDLKLAGKGESLPDYLRVVKVELDWLFKMQREDGAVYTKVTPENFGPFSKSDADVGGTQYVYDISTPDTALFAAVMSKASRIYRPYDAGFAKQALAAAEHAWAFLDKSGAIIPTGDYGTGGYVYGDDATQRFWAATELFKTTGSGKYHDYAKKHLSRFSSGSVGPLAWIDTESMGLITYYFTDGADAGLKNKIRDQMVNWADSMVNTVDSPINRYKSSLSVYGWASNKTALDNAVLLLVADRMAPNDAYVDSALDQLHYVLGRNSIGKSFVTSYGANSVQKPHNRTMFSLGKLVPGVLVGGPNKDAQDGLAPSSLGPRSYVDDTMAYSVNENSIEYNAPLVFVTAYFRPYQE